MSDAPSALDRCIGLHCSDGTVTMDFVHEADANAVFRWLEWLIEGDDEPAPPAPEERT